MTYKEFEEQLAKLDSSRFKLSKHGACKCGSNSFVMLEEISTTASIENGVLVQNPNGTSSEVRWVECDKCGEVYEGDELGEVKLSTIM
jgi:hypothetical protein